MVDCGEIGEIDETYGEVKFEWRIPKFFDLPAEVDSYYTSPYFPFTDTTWYLSIYPCGQKKHESKGYIGLYLHRGDSGYPKKIHYTIGAKRADGVVMRVHTETVSIALKGVGRGVPDFLNRSKIDRGQLKLDSCDTLTVMCYLKSDAYHTLKGGSFLSRATQTEESTNTVLCKDSRGESGDSVSFNNKGTTILSERMKNLLLTGPYHDITIRVKNQEFRAHKNILCTRSAVFESMFSHDTEENKTGTICIEDCDPDAFNEFLMYVYSGKTENLTVRKALGLYYVADKYDFPVLRERCVSFMKTELSVTDVCDVVVLAAKHGEKELLEKAIDFSIRNMEDIIVTQEWQRFMREYPTEANELYIKCLKVLLHKN